MICISARTFLKALPESARTSLSAKKISPFVGSISRNRQRPDGGLSAAGFADQPQCLALENLERDAVNRAHHVVAARDGKMFEQGAHAHEFSRPLALGRISRVRRFNFGFRHTLCALVGRSFAQDFALSPCTVV
jgi:hypothetical protein